VVDALAGIAPRARFDDQALNLIDWSHRVILVTVHRRESLGEHLHALCGAFRRILARHPHAQIVFPVHLNPRVRDIVFADLANTRGISLLEPLSYPDLLEVMRRSHFVMSDSGGIQEEAPSFRKPILILRTVTERPEVVDAGFGRLVGTDPDVVVAAATQLLTDEATFRRMVSGANPFGDGRAAERIVAVIGERFGLQLTDRIALGA
jgi:UDP-N-acetylglucosamine 2-epimerase (non-hydrolysing)